MPDVSARPGRSSNGSRRSPRRRAGGAVSRPSPGSCRHAGRRSGRDVVASGHQASGDVQQRGDVPDWRACCHENCCHGDGSLVRSCVYRQVSMLRDRGVVELGGCVEIGWRSQVGRYGLRGKGKSERGQGVLLRHDLVLDAVRAGVDVHRRPRRNATRVSPAWLARSTASEDGAETAARMGMPAMTAFWVSSNDARPLTSRTVPRQGDSVVLDGPADDLVDGIVAADVLADDEHVPSASNRPRRAIHRCVAKTLCALRSWSGIADSVSDGDDGGIVAGGVAADHPDGVDGALAAHAARRRGVEVAGHVDVGRGDVGASVTSSTL